MNVKLLTLGSLRRALAWIDQALQAIQQAVPAELEDLDDVNISSPSNGQVMTYNAAAGKWTNAAAPTGTIPSQTGNEGKYLQTDGNNARWEYVNHDFSHTSNAMVFTSTATVTFAANQRCTRMITVFADIGLTFAANNGADNYLWIRNSGSAQIDVTVSAVTSGGSSVNNVYVPSNGISVPAGCVCEIGIVVNADGAFITSRNDLAL